MSDFIPQYAPLIEGEIGQSLNDYIQSGGWITEFKKTKEFEQKIAEFVGSQYCVVTTSGTTGLIMSLMAIALAPEDEVIVPNYTMIATPNAVKFLNAKPVFVDIDPVNLCMDLEALKQNITAKTKAIIYVSLNGRSGDLNALKLFCSKSNIILIEDAAQSLGSYNDKRHLGSLGHMGVFSFSVPKIITTGQGGAVVTNDEKIYKKLKSLKDFGRRSAGHDIHDEIGFNFKFTDIQAVVGLEQFKSIDQRMKRKKEVYKLYYNQLKQVKGVDILASSEEVTPWFVDIYIDNPTSLQAELAKNGIGSRLVYPPIHHQKIYKSNHSYPVSEKYCLSGLWLPSHPQLKDQEILKVCNVIKEFFNRESF